MKKIIINLGKKKSVDYNIDVFMVLEHYSGGKKFFFYEFLIFEIWPNLKYKIRKSIL